ncbi:MAG: TetR/AcrR family transcriptional regulator [Pseudomonadales bacterium]|nr:TetR/AcrR family transcriptional regulator [Pseudomonadales bacterium]
MSISNPILAGVSSPVADAMKSVHPIESEVFQSKGVHRKKEDARTRILNTALTEFARRGYDGVSTTEIAKEAGVTQPLIHYHFKSKEALWQATVEQVFTWLKDEFITPLTEMSTGSASSALDNKAAMTEAIRLYVEFSAAHPEFGQFILREGTQKTNRLEWMVDQWMRPSLGVFIEAHNKGVSQGWIKNIPFAQTVTIVTASVCNFFALAPMIESLYGVNALDAEQVKIQSEAVIEIITNAIYVEKAESIVRDEEELV